MPIFVSWSRRGPCSYLDPRIPSLKACLPSLPAKALPAKALPARQPSPREEGPYITCTGSHLARAPLPSQSWRNSNNVIATCRPSLHSFWCPGQHSCDAVRHCSHAAAIKIPERCRNLAFRSAVARLPLASGISLVACSLKLPHHSLALLCPEFRARI